jgi:hypothetical protein
MLYCVFSLLFASLLLPVTALAAEDKINKITSATSAAPSSLSDEATVMDWDDTILRKGTNGWTCLPDRPDTPGNDPMCLDGQWLKWAEGFKNKTKPMYSQVGIGYMLAGDTPVSNSDPYATEPTGPDDWVDPGPHIMLLVPDEKLMKDIPTDHRNGGPYVMWKDTPYAHVMVPLPDAP